MNKERARAIVYDILTLLGLLALLTFICRLWPILLLIILGIFVAAMRLLYLSSKKVDVVEPMPLPALPEPKKDPTEKDVKDLAYAVILRKITELVSQEYPEARWVWEKPNARKLIEAGDEVYILLNRAGGYNKAKVIISNLQVVSIDYAPKVEPVKPENADEDDKDIPVKEENYELIAFEWVEAHIMELNSRCNEAIGEGMSELIIFSNELPTKDSWPDICKELIKAGLKNIKCIPEGIKIYLTQ